MFRPAASKRIVSVVRDDRVVRIDARANPLIKQIRRLATQGAAYRKLGQYWIEGEHLCRAAMARNRVAAVAVFAETYWAGAAAHWTGAAEKAVVVPDAMFVEISGLESAGRIGFVMAVSPMPAPRADLPSVILDRVQDAGNAGSILRSAAAFGFCQVLSLKGSAALWSTKVLRAAMGAHFGLALVEGLGISDVLALKAPLIVTSSHQGEPLRGLSLPWPCNWAFGHEGQGLDQALFSHAAMCARIHQPGGEESLNVAAAAAICLHASSIANAYPLVAQSGSRSRTHRSEPLR